MRLTRFMTTTGAAMRSVMAGLAAVLMVAGGAAAQDEKVDATLLVGKWVPARKTGEQFTIQFTKDGKVTLAATGGNEFKAEGTYKLDGNKLALTMKVGDVEKVQSRMIHSLTKSELISTDESGMKNTLVRVGDKN